MCRNRVKALGKCFGKKSRFTREEQRNLSKFYLKSGLITALTVLAGGILVIIGCAIAYSLGWIS